MPSRLKAAFICHLLVALGFVGMGIVYLVSPQFMPYHARVVGGPWAEITPPLQTLLLAFMRGSGAATLATSLAILTLLFVPFRGRQRWALHAVPAIGLCATLPLLVVVGWVEQKSNAGTPFPAVIAAIALQLLGWLLSLKTSDPT